MFSEKGTRGDGVDVSERVCNSTMTNTDTPGSVLNEHTRIQQRFRGALLDPEVDHVTLLFRRLGWIDQR